MALTARRYGGSLLTALFPIELIFYVSCSGMSSQPVYTTTSLVRPLSSAPWYVHNTRVWEKDLLMLT